MVDGATFPDMYDNMTRAQQSVVDLYLYDTKRNMTVELLDSGRVRISIDPDYLSIYHNTNVSR